MKRFKIDGKVAIITGGAGLLGIQHAKAVAEAGGIAVLWDINEKQAGEQGALIAQEYGVSVKAMKVDISKIDQIKDAFKSVLQEFHHVDILINNAAVDPKVSSSADSSWTRLENFSLELWDQHMLIGLTGAFLCTQIIGAHMASHGGGVILNISSDLGIISPDQRIYRKEGLEEYQQPAKPVSYSVVKHGMIGLTKYAATYWADKSVRVNAICPGGVYTDQPKEFVEKLSHLIPLGRMARLDEYRGSVQYLVSDASSYMTGAVLVVDGGRSTW